MRLGLRTWRAVHWLAYLCWPVALVHGLGTGSDVRASVAALARRREHRERSSRRSGGGSQRRGASQRGGAGRPPVACCSPRYSSTCWLESGPLRPAGPRRPGTPTPLLHRGDGRHELAPAETRADDASARAPSRPRAPPISPGSWPAGTANDGRLRSRSRRIATAAPAGGSDLLDVARGHPGSQVAEAPGSPRTASCEPCARRSHGRSSSRTGWRVSRRAPRTGSCSPSHRTSCSTAPCSRRAAVGADEVHVCVRAAPRSPLAAVERALAERRAAGLDRVRIACHGARRALRRRRGDGASCTG